MQSWLPPTLTHCWATPRCRQRLPTGMGLEVQRPTEPSGVGSEPPAPAGVPPSCLDASPRLPTYSHCPSPSPTLAFSVPRLPQMDRLGGQWWVTLPESPWKQPAPYPGFLPRGLPSPPGPVYQEVKGPTGSHLHQPFCHFPSHCRPWPWAASPACQLPHPPGSQLWVELCDCLPMGQAPCQGSAKPC